MKESGSNRRKWRILPLITDNAPMQMAIDEAILIARSNNLVPNTLRFYIISPPAITIGFFQSAEEEVNLDLAKEMGVNVVRRITGGGAVFHDKEITYSVIMSEKEAPENIEDSYAWICNGITEGLKLMGINARKAGINDVVVNNKKISGSAQTRKYGVLLQHGTILINADYEKMFSLLKVSRAKLKDKDINDIRERITCIVELTGTTHYLEELLSFFREGFRKALGIELSEQPLSPYEKAIAEKLYLQKYTSERWNFWR